MRCMRTRQSGITIIEVFVVIALLGLAISIVTAAITKAKAQARDTQRVRDVSDLATSLTLYYTDHQRFPISRTAIKINGEDPLSDRLIAQQLLQEAPLDPFFPDVSYYYLSNTDGSDFLIAFCLETNSIPRYYRGCNNIIRP